MKCSLDISNFPEEISSLSYSIFLFLYFFALIAEEGFLISPCYSLELYIQIVAYIYPTLYLLLLMNTTLLGALAKWFHKGTPNVIIFSFFPAGLMVFPREGSVIPLSGETFPVFKSSFFSLPLLNMSR